MNLLSRRFYCIFHIISTTTYVVLFSVSGVSAMNSNLHNQGFSFISATASPIFTVSILIFIEFTLKPYTLFYLHTFLDVIN